jgi:4-hydroxy-2-oxoheptanedioate aldolase
LTPFAQEVYAFAVPGKPPASSWDINRELDMRKNTVKQKLAQGKDTFGPFVNSPSPSMTELMGWLGYDFVIIDCEHGVIDYESAENMIRAAEVSGATAFVRIGLNEPKHILRFLEAGAHGVLMPMINNARDARSVVEAVRFPPLGQRGSFLGRGAMYGVEPLADYVKSANEEVMIALQIETLEALENQDEIIATPGADIIFLGPGDLSLQFGYPGQATHPRVIETIEKLTPKILKAGKQVGTITDPSQTKRWHDIGIRWHVTSTNRFLNSGARTYLDACRKALAG